MSIKRIAAYTGREESRRLTQLTPYAVLILFLCGMFSSPGNSQLTTGTISGTVIDPSGASVPQALIAVKNSDTGITRSTVTGPQGRYELANLPVGNYEISASLAGFQTSIRTGIALTVGRVALVDYVLQVGEVTQSVTVTGEASLVETTTATVSHLVDEKRVAELPLNNRDLTQLVLLQPGVLKVPRTGGGVFSGMGVTVSVGGARGNQNLFLLDGVSNSDISGNPQGASGSYIGAETVKEFQIITNNYSAEYQSAAGAIVSAVTKSGTNTLHGSGFWTLRNDNLDAAKWEDNATTGIRQEFKRNQFGGSLAGPIAQNRTFFFGSYEGLRERLNATENVRLFSNDARRGILPNQAPIPIDAQIRPYLDLYPVAGQGNTVVRDFNDGTVQVAGRQRVPVDDDFVAAKFDHQFSSEKAGFLTATYNWDDSLRSNFGILGDYRGSGIGSSKHTISLGYTNILSPTTLNEFKYGFSRSNILSELPLGQADTKALAFNPELGRMGEISPSPVASLGYRVLESQDLQETSQFKDGLSFVRGNHSYRVGGEVKFVRFRPKSCSFPCTGTWAFSSVADFLRNIPQSLDINLPGSRTPDRILKQLMFGAYVQDNWQVRPSLALNLGLRYEFSTVPDEEEERIANLVDFFDSRISAPASVQARFPNEQFAGTIGKMFTNAMKKSFGPRFGFAWAPGSRKTSLRGGFGVFYEFPNLYHFRNSLQVLPPFVKAGRLEKLAADNAGRPLRLQPGAVNLYGDLLAGQTIMRHMEYRQSNTYSSRWSLTLQRDFGHEWVASAGYTGSRAVHLWHQNSPNLFRWIDFPNKPAGRKQWANPAQVTPRRLNPFFSELRTDVPDGYSSFHGLSVGVQKRIAQAFAFQMAYNFSKSIDTGSGVSSGGDMLLESQRDIYYWDSEFKRGLSQFDIRNSLSLNFSYDLPGQELSGAAGVLGRGWQIHGIISVSDGSPLSIRDGTTVQNNHIGSTEGLRANLIPGGDNNPVLGGPNRYYDVSQFVPSFCHGDRLCASGQADYLPGFFGNAGRSTLFGPGIATVDLSTVKNFSVSENHRVQFRAELFNFLNRPNFGTPDTTPWLANGTADGNAARISTTRGSARQIQFGLKYIF